MKFTPHRYQQYCIDRALYQDALALWLDMGLGKTPITLKAIFDLKYNRFQVNKCLIIAPKRVAQATWQNEAAKWDEFSLLKISTVLGSQSKRVKALCQEADIYIINRENVQWLVDFYQNSWPFDMVVLDESTSFKNHQAKRFKKLRAVRPHINRIIELTGTPSPQGLHDLWAQIALLDGGERLGKNITEFRSRYFYQVQHGAAFLYKPQTGADETVRSLLGDICVSMKAEDWLELPDRLYNDVPVVLDERIQKQYNRFERDTLLELPEGDIDVASAAALTNKLLQFCNGAVYDEEKAVHEVHKCKVEAFLELIESLQGEPALVFYSFRHDVPRLMAALPKEMRVREFKGAADEKDWNDGKIDVLLAHPASCGYGLNLQKGGRHAVWFGLSYSLEQVLQANARLHRQGQEKPCVVHRLIVQNTRDVDVVQALEDKDNVQENLLQSLKARIDEVKKA